MTLSAFVPSQFFFAGYGSFSCEGCVPDTVNNARFVRDLVCT